MEKQVLPKSPPGDIVAVEGVNIDEHLAMEIADRYSLEIRKPMTPEQSLDEHLSASSERQKITLRLADAVGEAAQMWTRIEPSQNSWETLVGEETWDIKRRGDGCRNTASMALAAAMCERGETLLLPYPENSIANNVIVAIVRSVMLTALSRDASVLALTHSPAIPSAMLSLLPDPAMKKRTAERWVLARGTQGEFVQVFQGNAAGAWSPKN